MRKIFMYKNEGAKGQVDTFIKASNIKIRKKFDFILRYIADERNQFKEPYVKHFSIEKYKRLYELRLKAAGTMVRIIFYNIDENVILLNAFIKRDKRDTEQALEHALKLIEHLDRVAETPVDYLTEVEVN
ncbi:MAG: type II toxin-antitoxin system RelE/ParE family toxin [Clostridia bacterium]|nr:type II toxin-antitoxin system RelE/ParE family toxin [Clostridia bacterium]